MNAPNDLRPSANEYPVTQNGRARPFAAIDLSQHGPVSQVGVRADHRVSVDIDAAAALDEQSRANNCIYGHPVHILIATTYQPPLGETLQPDFHQTPVPPISHTKPH